MASKGKGQTLNRGECAEFFGVTPPTVDAWVRAGCPVKKGQKGIASEFNSAEVANFLRQKAREEGGGKSVADETELKRRKLAAEAESAELALAKAKEEVAPVREFERATAMLMAEIRTNIMNVPSRAVLQLLGETDETIFKAKLREELVLALETAADADLTPPEDDDEGLEDE
ncbi:putative terminase, small subunit [Pseudomonas phage PPpW-3]|uniref:Putative terminase, small subunit n=1 Tax=Pseudomonas phage PPpW-3 TaxID=1279082 RepID=V5YUM0_9CAUD|nr:terminase small subunit [Pseudomonas phage PPpW-3]BAO20601.1 putative terminase, small subunit [Pseudomonas phage PPpW-3]